MFLFCIHWALNWLLNNYTFSGDPVNRSRDWGGGSRFQAQLSEWRGHCHSPTHLLSQCQSVSSRKSRGGGETNAKEVHQCIQEHVCQRGVRVCPIQGGQGARKIGSWRHGMAWRSVSTLEYSRVVLGKEIFVLFLFWGLREIILDPWLMYESNYWSNKQVSTNSVFFHDH